MKTIKILFCAIGITVTVLAGVRCSRNYRPTSKDIAPLRVIDKALNKQHQEGALTGIWQTECRSSDPYSSNGKTFQSSQIILSIDETKMTQKLVRYVSQNCTMDPATTIEHVPNAVFPYQVTNSSQHSFNITYGAPHSYSEEAHVGVNTGAPDTLTFSSRSWVTYYRRPPQQN